MDALDILIYAMMAVFFIFVIVRSLKGERPAERIYRIDDFFEQEDEHKLFDDGEINPATGLIIEGGVDAYGNPYGCDSKKP